jgi:23S rRNA (uracil1939-C5)-methyltransferase
MAKAAGLAQLEAHASTCERFLADTLSAEDAARVTHVIVNPPRGGLSAKVRGALGTAAFPQLRELRYVSCNPQTLARDLAALITQGLVLVDAQPFDMFPQTEHVEVVASLRRQ